MGFHLTESRSRESHPTAKSRVRGIFGETQESRPKKSAAAQQPRWENHSTTTKLASGVRYYGYRYYDPVTGRWPSRDPIGERGGENLYGFVYNDPTGWIDILGLNPGTLYEFEEAVSKALDHALKDYRKLNEKVVKAGEASTHYEFFGVVCCKDGVADSKRYYYTKPLKGSRPGVAEFSRSKCASKKDVIAATYHTHPGSLPFSKTDMKVHDDFWKVPAFIVDATNSRNRYDPDPDYDPSKGDWKFRVNGGRGERAYWDKKTNKWIFFIWDPEQNKYVPKPQTTE
jgi:RHS repeat-associated protein